MKIFMIVSGALWLSLWCIAGMSNSHSKEFSYTMAALGWVVTTIGLNF